MMRGRAVRVLRLYHSGVVDEYRERERFLRQRHGYDVQLVCPPQWIEGGVRVEGKRDSNVPVHIVPTHGRSHPNLFWYSIPAVRRILRALQPAIVDVHEEPYSLAIAGVLYAIKRELPRARVCMYTAQNIAKHYPPPFNWIERWAMSSAATAYPCSTEAGQVLRSKGFQGDVRVVPLGVTLPQVSARSKGPFRVGFVGRLEPYKGGSIAVRAFATACRNTDAVLELIGTGSEEEALRAEAEATGLGERISFRGALSQRETLAEIAAFDAVLVPSLTMRSWKEQFGRVAAQALAAGTIVIASDSGSLREVVADAGILVPEGDVAAFAAGLGDLVRNPGFVADLREQGRQRAERVFSWEQVAGQVAQMYDLMLVR